MTEADWLKGKNSGRMLDGVSAHLTPRHWRFLACGLVRKVWDLLPAGPLQDAVEWAETHPDDVPTGRSLTTWTKKLDPAREAAERHAVAAMREVVRGADPDSAPETPGTANDLGPAIPSRPLFAAASTHAAAAVEASGRAAADAGHAVTNLLLPPGDESYTQVQRRVYDALRQHAAANQSANNALKLKGLGDEFADRFSPKTARVELAKAHAILQKMQDSEGVDREIRQEEAQRKAVAKQEVRLLHEVLGNPFSPPEFNPAWRTGTVVKLAKGIVADRAFDRLPILADALLDADCDAEAILRHCRGTELHLKGLAPQPHYRGCWVIELILDRWQPVPPPAADPPPRPRSPLDEFDFGFPDDDDDTAYA